MMTLFIGSYEVENVLLADLKLTAAAQTAADLVAQTTITGGSSATGVLQSHRFHQLHQRHGGCADAAADREGNSLVKIAFASVTYSTGTPVIDWHVEENNATAIIARQHSRTTKSLTNLGNAAAGSLDSVIVVQVQYTYTSPISYVLTRPTRSPNRPSTVRATSPACPQPRHVTHSSTPTASARKSEADVQGNARHARSDHCRSSPACAGSPGGARATSPSLFGLSAIPLVDRRRHRHRFGARLYGQDAARRRSRRRGPRRRLRGQPDASRASPPT